MDDLIRNKLNHLFREYTKKLPEKIASIEQQWLALQQHWDALQFKTFHRDVHSLCGSAGTYGYSDLSHTARELEIYLKNLLNTTDIDPKANEHITFLLNKLKAPELLHFNKEEAFPEVASSDLTKSVYVLGRDHALFEQLDENLATLGYEQHLFSDLDALERAKNTRKPSAIVIDSMPYSPERIKKLVESKNDQDVPVPLFCVVPNADLLPRLIALRAGCHMFFQKPVDVSYFAQVLNQKCSTSSDESYRVLIVDDSESVAKYYALILNQAGITAQYLTKPLELFNALETFQPNLLLMDIYMPECSGLELASVLRQEPTYTQIPIIFLSTEEDSDIKRFAISLGGDDFLTKPVSPQHLISTVRSRSKRASVLNYYMTTDSLTGLLNHSSILKQLDNQMLYAEKNQTPLQFVMLDIDYFKKVNDRYGHQIGDMVLKKLSNLLLDILHKRDCVGRYGGEEFAIILPRTTVGESEKLMNSLRIMFSQLIFKTDTTNFHVTFSAGISSYTSGKTSTQLVDEADKALYQAKTSGKNKVFKY